ncbi:putative Phosphoenolpyruvate/pyruvate domain-containing protein [Mycena chlorophos]|uniref:Putative Phosphoenolpyruvate/pyruvate domain-containing protein n=1 Tax=Mycena chlorophos TaxID=658473 RepID=A0A8H6TQN8_MYCCL|nr:putative Phosphoenolpyruvate/pyruvate domain-containing protein [Mycena chlorophos]
MAMSFPLRDKLASAAAGGGRARAAGVWLTLPSAAIAKTMAQTKGVSWVLVDAEHGLITDHHFYDLTNIIAASGVSPIIRIPADEPWMIKRALDSGAHGIMVPMANTPELVRKVVGASRYPPAGFRGYGPMFTHAAGALGADYKAAANDAVIVTVQIEHPDAVAQIDEIVKEGIDATFIGPFDLAVSMGVEFGGKEHEAAISRILEETHKAGKIAGIFCLTGEQAERRFAQGFDMVSVTTDIDTLVGGFADALGKVSNL